jgi:hypothetical protein
VLRHRLALRVLRRVHAVDHPVVPARAEQDVAAVQALAVEGDHHLVLAELVRLVGPGVPDLHDAGAVVAHRDLAREVDVLDRVVLGVDREVVALGVGRDALRDGPGDEHAVAFEPQVPVQPAGVVLVHHEALPLRRAATLAGPRLGGRAEVALGSVGVQAIGHGHRRYGRRPV